MELQSPYYQDSTNEIKLAISMNEAMKMIENKPNKINTSFIFHCTPIHNFMFEVCRFNRLSPL